MSDSLIRVAIPAEKRHRALVGAVVHHFCEPLTGFGEDDRYNLELAVDEAVANVIEHAYTAEMPAETRRVEVTLKADGTGVTVKVRDWGKSFNPGAVPTPDLDQAQEHGYGLFLMRSLVDGLEFRADAAEGNTVTLVKGYHRA
ncbi:MAG: ATP-binding protein [Anaerolineae bacterium]